MAQIVGTVVNGTATQAALNATSSFIPGAIGAVAGKALEFSGAVLATTGAAYVISGVGTLGAGFTGLKLWGFLRNRTVSSCTIDFTEKAAKGELRRAHGRDVLMDELMGAVRQGFGILVGHQGCGKTALVEELACRLANNEIPSLKGAKVIRLDLKKAEGGVGAEASLKNFWFGGVDATIRRIIELLETNHGKGKQFILFIDEIQDLLQGNIAIFDSFKEELARNNVKIIGATTDANIINLLRSRGGTGAGMSRRIRVINVQVMTKAEAEQVIKNLAADHSRKIAQEHRFTINFGDDVFSTIVEFSEKMFPGRILPDRAIEFFKDVCQHYQNLKSPLTSQMTLSRNEVIEYYARMTYQDVEIVKQQLEKINRLERDFLLTFFKEHPPQQKQPAFVVEEAHRFASFFQNNIDAPWMRLKGGSREFFCDVASEWSRNGRPVYRCDMQKLASSANTPEGRRALKEALAGCFRNKERAPILILENWMPGWNTVSEQQGDKEGEPPPASRVIQGLRDGVGQLKQFGRDIGLNNSEPPRSQPVSDARPDAFPDVIKDLFSFITEEKVHAVILSDGMQKLRSPSDSWPVRSLGSFTLSEMIEWLKFRYDTGDDTTIPTTLFALYNLHLPESVLDLSAKIAQLKAKNPKEDLLHLFLEALGGQKTVLEIKEALKLAETQIQTRVFDKIAGSRECSEALRSSLRDLLSSQKCSVLWVYEDSTICRQNIMTQIASSMPGKSCIHLNYAQIKEMPLPLKTAVLEGSRPSLMEAAVVVIEEEAVKDEAVMKLLLHKNKVVCFRTQKKEQPPAPPQNGAQQQVLDLVRDQAAQVIPQAAAPKSPFDHEFEYLPNGLSPNELKQLIEEKLNTFGVRKELQPALQNLYLFLITQPNSSVDQVFGYLSHDLPLYNFTSIETVCGQFREINGPKFGLSLNDVQYEVNPQMTSWGYRAKRGIIRGLLLLYYPIRRAAGYIRESGPIVTGFLVSTILGWIRRRFLPF